MILKPLLSIILITIGFPAFSQSIPFGTPINTGYDEYNPYISGNGRTLIFEQLYLNDPKAYVQISYQKNGVWTKPEQLPGANTEILTITNGGFSLNQTGNIVLFHSARYGGVGGNDIWMIEKNITGNWGAPKNLAKPINSIAAETDATLSPDGRFLYFTRLEGEKMPSGEQCGKIYVAERHGKDAWKMPVALPSPINKGCECAGKMLSDNKTFLFASMRAGGQGGYDIYKTKQKEDGTWEEPVPYTFINTPKDDKYVSVPAGGGLIFHSAPGKTGGLDVVRTPIPAELQPEKVTLLQGNLRNATNNLIVVPKVVVTNTNTNKSISYIGANDGTYTAVIPQDDLYDISIQAADGGFTYQSSHSEKYEQPKYEEKLEDAKLTPLKLGVKFKLNNMAFINNSDTLVNYSSAEVHRLFILLKAFPTLKLEIGAHTNTVISDTIARDGLTHSYIDSSASYIDTAGIERRIHKTIFTSNNTKAQAEAVVKALIKKGIPRERIKPEGYGDSQPLNPAPADPRLNQRIEAKIIGE